jgi:FkbM family methyltransferase
MKYSIVIPTYNHCEDLLKPCLASIIACTHLQDLEVIVVANGCQDATLTHVLSLGDPFKLIVSDHPLGYTKAVNQGIKRAQGEYIVLMNDDCQLLPQPKNHWLDILHEPFVKSHQTGITGPVKFAFDCGGIIYDSMAFWLVMIPKKLFDNLGLLDESFNPGMGEDGDFSIRVQQAGYDLISVPQNNNPQFGLGIAYQIFPVYHKGNGTFDTIPEKLEIIARNTSLLTQKYGLTKHKNVDVSIVIPTYNHFLDAFKPGIDSVLKYTDLSNKEIIVVANGCTDQTYDYLQQLKDSIDYVWIQEPVGYIHAVNAGIAKSKGKHVVLFDNDCVLLDQNVDSWIHILKQPFDQDPLVAASSPFAQIYDQLGLVLHSGCTMYRQDVLVEVGMFDKRYHPGYFSDSDVSLKIQRAGYKCVEVPYRNDNKNYVTNQKENLQYFEIKFPVVHLGNVQTMDKVKDNHIVKANRDLLYETHMITKTKTPKYSIIIPTYNHCDDLLIPCLTSIKEFTSMDLVEVIVVANGCKDNTHDYVKSLGAPFKLLEYPQALGYTRATNLGIQAAQGEFLILLNNDTQLLPQPKNHWLEMLESPMSDPTVGLTGPLELFDNYANHKVLIFFCVMIKRELLDKIGLLDEVFSPGGGEDIDFTVRALHAGYHHVMVPSHTALVWDPEKNTNTNFFPIWHKENKTFGEIDEYSQHIVKRNGLINTIRYNNNIKLNLGAGGIDYPGYLSVDKFDPRSDIKLDICDLSEFANNSVTEILASHVFEHLNPYHALAILAEWRRVLKPGGKLIMEMPDILKLCERFVTASTGERYGILNAIYGSVNTTDQGTPDQITSPHLFGWWRESLFDHLTNSGYVNIEFMDEQIPHPQSNLRVEAQKPLDLDVTPVVNRLALKQQEPATYMEIFELDNYQLNDAQVSGSIVIDIGANLGMFSLRCWELGAKQIIAVEANPWVFQGLAYNVAGYKNIQIMHKAVLDQDHQHVLIKNEHVGSKISSTQGDRVDTITLETIVKDIFDPNMILKLDCEGSEFEIVLSSPVQLLRRFKSIHLEIHGDCNENPAYHDPDLVRNKLTQSGFHRVWQQGMVSFTNDGQISGTLPVWVEKWIRQ